MKAWMFKWNESLSPLDGAVVEKRGGGTSLCADVNKNSHFKPVCALTDHSKHYARHRGWTTLGYSTEIILHRVRGDADKAAGAPLQVLFPFRLLTFVAVTRISVSCLVSGAIAPLPILSYVPVSGKEKKRGWGGGGALLVQADEENKQVQIWFLVEVERASRRVCHQTHLHSSRFSLHPPRVHPSIHRREGLFTFGAAVSPSVCSPHRWGGAVHHHSWGIFMQPPLRRHKPVVTKSPNPPITPRCGIGLKEPDFVRPPTLSEPTTFKVFYIPARLFFSFCFVLVNRCRFPFQVREHLQVWRLALEGGVVMADHHHRHLALRF